MKSSAFCFFAFIVVLSANARGGECAGKHGCTLSEIDFSARAEKAHRSRYVIKLGVDGVPIPERFPILALYPPAFSQKYISIFVNSSETYSVSDVELSDVNKCIAQRRLCYVPMRGQKFKEGDYIVLEYYQENLTDRGEGGGQEIQFMDGLDSRVVLMNFQGKYAAQGARVRHLGNAITFESTGNGRILFSELPNWGVYAKRWVNKVDKDAVEGVAKDIFARGIDPEGAVRAARQWIAENIKYEYKPQTVLEMQQPASVSDVLSSRQGDCKGMTVLLQPLLASIGIDSHPVFTRLGGEGDLSKFDVDIPIPSYFDHVILYVPVLDRYYDPTLRVDQIDEEITDYMYFALHADSGELACFGAHDCKGIARYHFPQ